MGGSTGEAFVQSLSEREQVLEIVAEEAKGKINSSPTSVASAPPKANNLRHRLNVMASMPSPPSRRSTILSALKNTAITIGQLLIRRMVCRWWCTTFQPEWGKTDPGSDQHTCYIAWRRCAETDSGDLYQMEQIRREHPDLVLYNGYDEIFASGLLAGADGGIGSTYNIMAGAIRGSLRR